LPPLFLKEVFFPGFFMTSPPTTNRTRRVSFKLIQRVVAPVNAKPAYGGQYAKKGAKALA